MTRLGCFADTHMGAYLQYADDRLGEQEQVLRQAVQAFNTHGVDTILFAGDATHRNKPTPAELLAFTRPLLQAEAPVLAISGNSHDVGNTDGPIALDLLDPDPLSGFGVLNLIRRPRVLNLDIARATNVDVDVCALPWTSVARLVAAQNGGDRDAVDEDAAAHLIAVARGLREQVPDGRACVLLTHFAISGDKDGLSTLVHEPVLPLEELETLGFDAVIAGHFHRPQVLSDGPPIFYCGSPFPLDFSEGEYKHGVWILDVEPGWAEARFVPLESRRFLTLDYSPELEWFGGETDDVTDAIVRVRYTATEEQARRISTEAIRQALLAAGAHRVFVQPTIVRESRARVEGMTAELTDAEAFRLWLDAESVEERLRPVLMDAHARYVGAMA